MVIIYNSYTGYSLKFATLASKALNIPIVNIDNINSVNKAEDIIYISCIHNDKISRIKELNGFDLALVCAIGGMPYSEEYINLLRIKNNISSFYYFEGGISYKDISYFNRLKLSNIKKRLTKKEKNKIISIEERVFLSKLQNGKEECDYSSIKLVISWYLNKKTNEFIS